MIGCIGNLSREIETVKTVPTKNSGTENLSEIRNSLDELNSRLEMMEERIRYVEVKPVEINQSEERRKTLNKHFV